MPALSSAAVPISKVSDLIARVKQNFLEQDVNIVEGLSFNQYNTIRKIHLYLNNQFESGPHDTQGNRKYFYNLCNYRNDQATKNIDIDSKDIQIGALQDASFAQSFFLRAEWTQYVKDENFGAKLNELVETLPRMGSVVWRKEKVDGKLKIVDVDLRNVICDPTAFRLQDGPMIYRHIMSGDEIRGMTRWNKEAVDAYLAHASGVPVSQFMGMGDDSMSALASVSSVLPEFPVYEYWGDIPETLLVGTKILGKAEPRPNASRYCQVYCAGIDGQEGDRGEPLYIKEVDRSLFPFEEIHYRRMKGRWLGQGNVERLFPLQERANELVNRFYRSLRIGTIHLFQTRDRLFTKNVLTDMEDGDILETKSEINPIATELRAFNQYQNELRIIESQADRECNTFEVITGETLPTNTPFRLGSLQAQSAGKIYDFIRENIGLFLEVVLNKWLLPSFAKKLLSRSHILDVVGGVDELARFDEAFMKIHLYDAYKNYVMENNRLPNPEQIEVFKSTVLEQISKDPRKTFVPAEYWEEMDYKIFVTVTGEGHNKASILESLTTVFQTIMTNPAALQDPRVMTVFNKIMEESGAMSPLALASVMGQGGASAAMGAMGKTSPAMAPQGMEMQPA